MKIRKATLKDSDVLTNLLEHLFTQEKEFEFNPKLHKKALRKILKDKTIGEIFVVIKNENIVGCVNILYTISTALGGKVALLEDMIIVPQYRQRGYGTKLIKKVFAYLQKNSIKRVTLLTDDDNFEAHRFYENLGFEASKMKTYRKRIQ